MISACYLIIIRIYVTCSHYLHDCGPTSWSILFYVVDLVSGVQIQTDPNKNRKQINKIENRKIEILLHFFGSLSVKTLKSFIYIFF